MIVSLRMELPRAPRDLARACFRVRDLWTAESGSGLEVVAGDDPRAGVELVVRQPEALPARGGLRRALESLDREGGAVVPSGAWPGGPSLPAPCVTAWELDALSVWDGPAPAPATPENAPVVLRRRDATGAKPGTGGASRAGGAVRCAPGFFVHSFLGRKSHSRPDVAALLPRDVRSVLDIGCGEGAFGAALERDGVRVIGIEHDLEAARVAESRLTRVLAADVDDALDEIGEGVDAIVLADVLEHLRDPLGVLSLLADRARDTARLVVSVPNAAHASVLAGLLQGRFDPALEGIVAEDHVTYAGRTGWVALLAAGGWEVEEEAAVRMLPPSAEPWAAALRTAVPSQESGSLDVLQWLFRLRRAPRRALGHPVGLGAESLAAFDEDDPMSALTTPGAETGDLPNAASAVALEMLLSCGLATGLGAEMLRRAHTEKGLRRRLSSRWLLDMSRSGGALTGRAAVAADAAAALGLPVDRQALETDVLRVRVSPA